MKNISTNRVKNFGFSLVSTLIGLSLSAILLVAVFQLYSSVTASSQQVKSKGILAERSSMAILQLSDDIKISGSFGCFNARVAGAVSTLSLESIPITITGVARFESSYAGLYAFNSTNLPTDGALGPSDNLLANSDILKLQFAENFAFLSSTNAENGILYTINFEQPNYSIWNGSALAENSSSKYGLNTSNSGNSAYVLASCSRLDERQGTITGTSLAVTNGIPIANHDRNSLRLMNFVTKYYYVAMGGNGLTNLYTKVLLPNGALSAGQLVLQGVNSMNVSFEVESSATSRQIKNRSQMATGDWAKINQVILTMQIRSPESSGLNYQPVTESITQSIQLR